MRTFTILKLGAVVAAAALGVCAWAQDAAQVGQGGSAPASAHEAPKLPEWKPVPVGHKAPNFEVFSPEGKKVHLSDLKGKTVILDFWATWCGPCQITMPRVESVYQQIKDDNVVVLSVNTWDEDKDFKDWVAKNSGTTYHFDFVRDPAEGDHDGIRSKSIAKRLYHVIGIPTMYVIDKDGKVAGSILGSGDTETQLAKILGNLGITVPTPTSK